MKKALIFIGILIGIFVLSIVAASLRPEGVLAYLCGCDAPAGVTTGCECTVSCGEQTACGNTVRCGFDCGGGDSGGGDNPPPPPPPPPPANTPTPTPSITPTPPFSLAFMGIKLGSIAENQVLNVAQILDAYPLYPTPTPKLDSLELRSLRSTGGENSSSPKSGGFSSIFSFLWKLFF